MAYRFQVRSLALGGALGVLLLGAALLPPARVGAATAKVGGGSAASCTEAALRAAVSGGGRVTFDCGPAPVTIPLSAPLVIDADTEIDGGDNGQGGVVSLSGSGRTRVIEVASDTRLTVRNLTIRDGYHSGRSGAGLSASSSTSVEVINCRFENNRNVASGVERASGALHVHAGSTLLVRDSVFVGNRAVNGGAIHVLTSGLTVEGSSFTDNEAESYGGAIYIDGASNPANNGVGGRIVVRESSFTANQAGSQGGAVFSYVYPPDSVTISGATFTGNVALAPPGSYGRGGALRHGNGALTIAETTFAGNVAYGSGGAVWASATSPGALTNVTFVENRAEQAPGAEARGGALWLSDGDYRLTSLTVVDNYAAASGGGLDGGGGPVVLENTLLSNNRAGDGSRSQCGTVFSGGGNLQYPAPRGGEVTCAPGSEEGDPRIAPLGPNGGATHTIALAAGSAAIDRGSGCPPVDQRGYPRIGPCDIGAFEYAGQPFVATSSLNIPFVQR